MQVQLATSPRIATALVQYCTPSDVINNLFHSQQK